MPAAPSPPLASDLAARRFSPAAERNRVPLLDVLRRVLPPSGRALEIASGTGQHAAHFAAGLPGWTWQPSDADPGLLASIAAWCEGLPNVRPPLVLDLLAPDRGDRPSGKAVAAGTGAGPSFDAAAAFDAVFCANLLHIAPWAACPALMRCAARCLVPDGLLVLYGPFIEDEVPTAPSNLAFDADLRARDPAWGLRRLAEVRAEAQAAGLAQCERFALPANNLALVFVRT